jgi:hypothetical protein
MKPLAALLVLASAALASCKGSRVLANPTLSLRTSGGRELGVATEYGVVFLGRTAQSGRIEIEAWYGDGPNIEPAVIEPIGAGLFTAETEIRMPEVALSFVEPKPGSHLTVVGQDEHGPWESTVTVAQDPRALGILTTIPSELVDRPDQIGAGVYVTDPDTDERLLIGLYAGRIHLSTKDGERDYMAVVGPTDLWRLVAHRRDLLQRKRWVYREDIL